MPISHKSQIVKVAKQLGSARKIVIDYEWHFAHQISNTVNKWRFPNSECCLTEKVCRIRTVLFNEIESLTIIDGNLKEHTIKEISEEIV